MGHEGHDLTLVLMAGMPGTGKTTLALALGQTCGWPVIDKDSLKSPLLAAGASPELAGPASYTLMLEIAQDLLTKQHLSVILDSPGRFPSVLAQAQGLAGQAGASLKIIQCQAPRALRNRRLAGRAARPSQWTADAGLSDAEEREMFAHLPAVTLVLDTSTPWEACLASATAYLRQATEPGEPESEPARLQLRAFRLARRLAAVVVVNDREHLLVQYRGPRAPTSPGQWSLPGGGIETGETAEMAAYREIGEETGLQLDRPLEPLWQGLLPSMSSPGAYNEWWVFLSHTRAGQSEVTVGEGEVMVFLPLSEVLRLTVAPSTRYVLSLWLASRVERA